MAQISDVMMVDPAWIVDCFTGRSYVNEEEYLVRNVKVYNSSLSIASSQRQRTGSALALSSRPSSELVTIKASIAPRRSDVASIPLRPDGVFKSVSLSLFGWSDTRMEGSLSYQITANGGSLVDLSRVDQFACICADGSRPTREGARLVSQRWVTDCLAQSELIDPLRKTIYTPSYAQLPLLLTTKVCVYVTEKDQEKFDAIAEIAKLCGIRYISRNETRTPLSVVTHFVFHDMVSVNRRRDLIPIASKAGKFIVSLDWLKDTYLFGAKQDESKYDLSQVLEAPALCAPLNNPFRFLEGINLILADEGLRSVCTSAGATAIDESGHSCSQSIFRISEIVCCECPTISETWIRECISQNRLIEKQSYTVRVDDGIDHIMAAKDPKVQITWRNTHADSLSNSLKED